MKKQFGSAPAVVALVLFFAAAVPSYATQHRDPVMPAENAQKPQPDGSAAASISTPKVHTNSKTQVANSKKSAKTNVGKAARNSPDSKDHSGGTTKK
jgi:hypothetical protein